MNYPAAFQDFFKSPKWTMNLVLGAVCSVIPVAGLMVIMGWLLNGFWGRSDERAETFPDFTFDNFGKKLERGLWPALLFIIAMVVLVPVIAVASFILVMIVGSNSPSILGLFIDIVILALFGVVSFFLLPILLRAGLMQDFSAGFNMPFLKRFISLTKTELALSVLSLAAAQFVMMLVGKVFCIGLLLMLALIPLINYAWAHLSKQLYQLYLSRGGEPLAISPKLTDSPEADPPAEPPLAPPSA